MPGRDPHMYQYVAGCREQARAVLLGATNSWFPITLSALAIPLARDPISQLVQVGWDYFADLDCEAEVAVSSDDISRQASDCSPARAPCGPARGGMQGRIPAWWRRKSSVEMVA